MKKEIITCDICGGQGRSGYSIQVEERYGNGVNPYKYSDICAGCSHEISVFIREKMKIISKIEPKPLNS